MDASAIRQEYTAEGRGFRALWLGEVEYGAAWDLQRELSALRQSGRIPDTVLLLEHPRTITLGRASREGHILESRDRLHARGFRVFEVDRGGDVTYHGPGQLVGYPIVDLRNTVCDIHVYIRTLESALIEVLSEYGIEGLRRPPHTGVWVGERKIAAIGIKVSKWVTSHGFALNVDSDLSDFDTIVPCGIREFGVTSIARELMGPQDFGNLVPHVAHALERRLTKSIRDSGGPFYRGALELSPQSEEILSRGIDAVKSVVIDYRPLSRGVELLGRAGEIK